MVYTINYATTLKAVDAFEPFMCQHHTPAEALASSWAAGRPISIVQSLLGEECNQRLFNAAFLGTVLAF
jgi:hypothetical protein